MRDAIERSDQVTCPLLLHFGDNDPTISDEAMERIRRHVEARLEIEMYVNPGEPHVRQPRIDDVPPPRGSEARVAIDYRVLARQG